MFKFLKRIHRVPGDPTDYWYLPFGVFIGCNLGLPGPIYLRIPISLFYVLFFTLTWFGSTWIWFKIKYRRVSQFDHSLFDSELRSYLDSLGTRKVILRSSRKRKEILGVYVARW